MSDVSSEFDSALRARALRQEQAARDAVATPYRRWVGGLIYLVVVGCFFFVLPDEFDARAVRALFLILLVAVGGLCYEVWVLRRRVDGLIRLMVAPPAGPR
ncbi:hypothetical protein BH09PSE6_BH09PSE6_20200 [soil metagenome]